MFYLQTLFINGLPFWLILLGFVIWGWRTGELQDFVRYLREERAKKSQPR